MCLECTEISYGLAPSPTAYILGWLSLTKVWVMISRANTLVRHTDLCVAILEAIQKMYYD